MRKAQLVKRRRTSFVLLSFALLWVGMDMGIDAKSGVIARDFNVFLQDKLKSVFAGKEIKLARMEGGLFRSLTVDDVKIGSAFSVDRVILRYNLFNLLLRRYEKFGGIYLISPALFFNSSAAAGGQPGPNMPSMSASLAGQPGHFARPIACHALNGTIFGPNKKPIVSNLTGSVEFFNSNLRFNNVKGNFMGLPVIVNGSADNLFGSPVLKLRLSAKERYYTARLAFKTTPKNEFGAVWGYLNVFDKYGVNFKGRINFGTQNVIKIEKFFVEDLGLRVNGEINVKDGSAVLLIEPKTGFVKVTGSLSEENGLSIFSKASHLNFFGSDFLSDIIINTKIHQLKNEPAVLSGSLKTQNLIINYKPFKEISARWVWKKDKFFINSLSLGDTYRLMGSIGLRRPYDLDLKLNINGAHVADWLVFSKYGDDGIISGVLSGEVTVRGPLKEPSVKVKLNLKDGNIKDLKFDSINLNLKGKGPVLAIHDSRIVKEDGCLYIDGEVNLAKLGKRNVFEDVRVETDQKTIVWEGWDVSKDIDTSEVKLKKDINEDFRINFKTYSDQDKRLSEQSEGEVGLDYKIHKNDSINLRMKEDEAVVGVERKVKF
ncbi:MAG: hypothetical protein NTV07_07415 [Candidatus Omnitrophica bacterium]|nr:hypothetical protein [Candidatus Omnitrophota bacterium]